MEECIGMKEKEPDTFKNNKDVLILVATDAASEGINSIYKHDDKL